MPTIPCPDCGRECSTEAAACPNCGRPCKKVDTEKSSPVVDVLFYGSLSALAVTAIVLGVWWSGGFDRWLNRIESEDSSAQAASSAMSQPTKQSTPSRASVVSPQALAAAQDAMKALRKLDAATQVGVNFVNYQPLVIDARAKVDEAVSLLPIEQLKSELRSAIDAYADAASAWNDALTSEHLIISQPPGDSLARKYGLNGAPLYTGSDIIIVPRGTALTTMWRAGRAHIDRASSLLNQYPPSPSETN